MKYGLENETHLMKYGLENETHIGIVLSVDQDSLVRDILT